MRPVIANRREAGLAMLEALVALTILGLTAATFITGLATTARADLIVNEQTSAESLARSQLDYIKGQSYIDFSVPEHGDYTLISPLANYGITVSTVPINPATGQPLPSGQDNGVQKIAVSVTHYSQPKITLETYKVNR